MRFVIATIVILVVVFALARIFQLNLSVSFGSQVATTPTLTHEQEIRAPFETVRAELEKIRATPSP